MSFARDFSRGIQAYGKAINLLFSCKLWYFMLFPVVIVIALFVVGNYAVGYLGDGGKSDGVDRGNNMAGMDVGSGWVLGEVADTFPILYFVYLLWRIRGNDGDVSCLLVAFGANRGYRVGTGVPV